MKHTVYLGLGSNIEAGRNLPLAVRHMAECLALSAVSPVYRTPPWGYTDQDDFLNAVLSAQTPLPPLELLERMQAIELSLGRERTLPNGPRTLDIDILFHGSEIMDHERLTLPHPRLHERGFVLVPLCDIAPDLMHPRLGKPARELLTLVNTEGIRPAGLELKLEKGGNQEI